MAGKGKPGRKSNAQKAAEAAEAAGIDLNSGVTVSVSKKNKSKVKKVAKGGAVELLATSGPSTVELHQALMKRALGAELLMEIRGLEIETLKAELKEARATSGETITKLQTELHAQRETAAKLYNELTALRQHLTAVPVPQQVPQGPFVVTNGQGVV